MHEYFREKERYFTAQREESAQGDSKLFFTRDKNPGETQRGKLHRIAFNIRSEITNERR